MRIKLSTIQDVHDDSAHTPSLHDADAGAGNTSDDSVLETMPVKSSIHTGRYIVLALVLFTIAAMIFVLMGGLRWLRRLSVMQRRGRYRKVSGEDPEK